MQVANQIAKKRELLPVARQLASTVRAREEAFARSAHPRTMPRIPFVAQARARIAQSSAVHRVLCHLG